MSIEAIEQLAKDYSRARAVLSDRVKALHDEIADAKRRKVPGIKSAASDAKDAHLQLIAAVKEHRALFDKPKSRVLHGVKLGLRKGPGVLSFGSVPQLIGLIRKHMADKFDVLVKTKELPNKAAIQRLPASDLKKLGCTITHTGDEVFATSTDSEVDKLVSALLDESDADSDDDEQEAA